MSAKMTNQSHYTDIARTVDEGAIFELSFIYRWHKPAAAYALTPKMAEVADYTDGTFHKVLIRETGEILSTREFKRNFKVTRKPYLGKRTSGKHEYNKSTGSYSNNTYQNTEYTFKYYMHYNVDTNMIYLVAYLSNGKEQVQIVNTYLEYTEDNWNVLVCLLEFYKTLYPNNGLPYQFKEKLNTILSS